MTIRSINWTYTAPVDSLTFMDTNERSQDLDNSGHLTSHECECPEPCNCDHENE